MSDQMTGFDKVWWVVVYHTLYIAQLFYDIILAFFGFFGYLDVVHLEFI